MNRSSRGMTLVELLVAVLFLGFGLLAVAPLFVHAARDNAVGADIGYVGAAAVAQMEQLRELGYYDSGLQLGGGLTSDVAGYFDDSDPAVLVRWEIRNNAALAGTRIVTVQATAGRSLVGRAKRVTVTVLRGDE